MKAAPLESGSTLRAIILASPLAVVALDPHGKISLWNPAAQRLFGWTEAEVLGQVPPYVPAEEAEGFRAMLGRELGGEIQAGLELRRQRRDGSLVDVRLSAAPIRGSGGEVTGVVGIFEDISQGRQATEALRQSEQRLSLHVQQTPLGVIEWNTEFQVVRWNPSAERIFGYTEGEAVGRHADFILPASVRGDVARVWRNLQQGRGGHRSSNENVTRAGRTILCEWYNTPLVTAEGRIIGVASLVQDVTDRRRADAEIAARTRQLEASRAVAAEISRELDLDRLLSLLARRTTEAVGTANCGLYLWDEAAQQLLPHGFAGAAEGRQRYPRRLGEGVVGRTAAARRGLCVNDYRTSPLAHPRTVQLTRIAAVLAEPILHRDRLIGVIAVDHEEGSGTFTSGDQQCLALLADHAAIAIENARLYQEAERQRREAEVVADLAARLNASLDLDTVLQRVAEGAKELTGSDLAQIALWDATAGALRFRYWAGPQHCSHAGRLIELGKGVGGCVLATGEPFRTADYAADPRITTDYLMATLAEGVVAELAVPVRIEGRVEGVLFVSNRSPRPFSDADERTLLRLADHAGIAIENARLHTGAVQRARQLATLTAVTRTLTTTMDPERVGREILAAIRTLFPDVLPRLWKMGADGCTLERVASAGLYDPARWATLPLQTGQGLLGLAVATGEPVFSSDASQDPRAANLDWVRAEGLVSSVTFPLAHGGRIHGALAISTRTPYVFSPEEVDLLRSFAVQAGIALENARLFEEVSRGQQRLWQLNQRIVSAQEEERHRLSRELHDEAGQALTALRIGLDLVRQDLPPALTAPRQRLAEALSLAADTTDQIRRLAQALRPPALDTLGLDSALEGFCRSYAEQTRLDIVYSGKALPAVPELIGIHLYRCLQEALTNVTKHAHARRARVALEWDGEWIRLRVEDDGVGFETAALAGAASIQGIGVAGMRERLDALRGRLELTSRPGQGTCLIAVVPWTQTA